MAFWWVFEVLTRMYDGWSASDMGSVYKYYSSADSPLQANRILISMTVITLVSVSAFAFERIDLDFCWVTLEDLKKGTKVYPLELIPYILEPGKEIVHFVSKQI